MLTAKQVASKGYTKSNCRIVCNAANIAMFNWGEDVLKTIATAYVVRQILPKTTLVGVEYSVTPDAGADALR